MSTLTQLRTAYLKEQGAITGKYFRNKIGKNCPLVTILSAIGVASKKVRGRASKVANRLIKLETER